MRPPRINEGVTFGPGGTTGRHSRFDEAWGSIAGRFSPSEYDSVRNDLAEAIMNVAREESSDVAMIRAAGVRASTAEIYLAVQGPPASKFGYPIDIAFGISVRVGGSWVCW